MEFKICSRCNIELAISNFGKLKNSKDGYRYDCKGCRKQYRINNQNEIKITQSNYYKNNKTSLLKKSKEYSVLHKTEILEQRKNYRAQEHVKQHIRLKNKEYLPIRKENIKLRRKTDLNFQLQEILRSKFNRAIKRNTYCNFLGCDINFFKKWIEYRFDDKMNWDNIGTVWQFDHILPISLFDFKKDLDIKTCFHWTNFQPLLKEINREKTNKIEKHYYFNNLISVFRFNSKYTQYLGYQAVNESLQWLRNKELRYGNNASYDVVNETTEMDNPQPSSVV